MKSKTLTWTIAMTLLAALAVPVRLAAQKQIRYTVTDFGFRLQKIRKKRTSNEMRDLRSGLHG
jgi:hypothetical protein